MLRDRRFDLRGEVEATKARNGAQRIACPSCFGTSMKRDTLINVLLIIAGIVLAFVLFEAGVLWKSKTLPKTTRMGGEIGAGVGSKSVALNANLKIEVRRNEAGPGLYA